MEGASNLLKNPWVIGGGLGVLVLLFMMRGSSGGSGAADPNTLSAIVSNNQIGQQALAVQTNAAVSITQAQLQEQGTIFGSLAQLASVVAASNGQTQMAAMQANAGIISSAVQSSNAMAADFATNMARSQQAVVSDNSAVIVAKVNGAVAKAQANANMWASISQSAAQLGGNVAKAMVAG